VLADTASPPTDKTFTFTAGVAITPPNAAVILAFPTATPVTTPVLAPTLTTFDASDVQLTLVVISAVVPSEYVPVAVKLAVALSAIDTIVGVTEMLLKLTDDVLPLLLPPPQPVRIKIPPKAKAQRHLPE
jgi:hypothetical protein